MNRPSIERWLRYRAIRRRGRIGARVRRDARNTLIAVASAGFLGALLSTHFVPNRVELAVGQRSPSEIRAARTVYYTDTDATKRAADVAAASVPSVYSADGDAQQAAVQAAADAFARIRRVRTDTSSTPARKLELMQTELGWLFGPAQFRYLASVPSADLQRLETVARRLLLDAMSREIRTDTDDLVNARSAWTAAVRRSVGSPPEVSILQVMGSHLLRPNRMLDRERTERRREAAWASARAIRGRVRAGDVVVPAGATYTQTHHDICAALGMVRPSVSLATLCSVAVLACGMVMLAGVFVRVSRPDLYASPKHLVVLSLIGLAAVVAIKASVTLNALVIAGVQVACLGLLVGTVAAMLVTVLVDAGIAIVVVALLSALSCLLMNPDIRFPVMMLVSGMVATRCVADLRTRGQLLRAGAILAAVGVCLVWCMGGALGDAPRVLVEESVWALAWAVLAVPVFWLALAALEKPFGILTHVWLLELAAADHPLLRQLCVTAPATYAHSIMVGNLAEAAADAIGADALLARVGSYYHDVGKLRRPHCFAENQTAENIHDRLSPALSVSVIASHVRDGLELAAEHRIPVPIRDIVAQHHGSSLIRYFYHQALAEQGTLPHDVVLEQHYRYDGPRPQTRESGIIMLADAVEASARCLDRPTPARVQTLVENIVSEKVTDGQLDECDLTYRNLQVVQRVFVRTLTAMHHARLEYPEQPHSGGSAGEAPIGPTTASSPDHGPAGTPGSGSDASPTGSGTADA